MLSENLFQNVIREPFSKYSEALHKINFWISDQFLIVAFFLLVPKSFGFFQMICKFEHRGFIWAAKDWPIHVLIAIKISLNHRSLAEI